MAALHGVLAAVTGGLAGLGTLLAVAFLVQMAPSLSTASGDYPDHHPEA